MTSQIIPFGRQDSVMSVASVDEEPPVVPEPLPGMAAPEPVSVQEWDVLEQTIRVDVDLEREELRGTIELRVRLPSSPPLTQLRLHCAAQCRVHRATLGGAPLEWRYAAHEASIDQVVPYGYQRTRDLGSFRSIHGAIVHAAHDGELTLQLPPPAEQPADALLVISYSVSRPRGGVHFVRGRDGHVAYAHTVGEAGAARRWMPCLDRPDLRCHATLEVTADASLECFGSGVALQPTTPSQVDAAAAAAAAPSRRVASARGASSRSTR